MNCFMVPVRVGLVVVPMIAMSLVGCRPPQSGPGQSGNADPIASAINNVEDSKEKPYLEASRGILAALVQRDYSRFFDHFSPVAFQDCNLNQFTSGDDPNTGQTINQKINGLNRDEFLQKMSAFEASLGKPWLLNHVYVQTIDPAELAGKSDAMANMFNIGNMSTAIPNEIRRASLRAQINCQLPAELVEALAAELKVPVADIQAGKFPDDFDLDEVGGMYFSFKFVLIEENGQLKIGYFEFLPPSILD